MDKNTDFEQVSTFDVQSLIIKYLKNWIWFVISAFIAITLAWLYLRYTPKEYASTASILISTTDKKNNGVSMSDFANVSLGGGIGGSNLQDEISIMKSKPLLYDLVKKLNLDVQFSKEGRILSGDIFGDTPVDGKLFITDPKKFITQKFTISPVNNSIFKITYPNGSEKKYRYGNLIPLNNGSVKIERINAISFKQPFNVTLNRTQDVVNHLEGNIIGDQDIENNSNIVSLTLRDKIPEKSELILNELIKQYNKDAIDNKNLESNNTAAFIDGRLDLITKELGNIEEQKASYKRNNQITDLVTQAQISVENANDATKKIMEVGTQLEMVNSILTYANSANNEQLLPSNMGMSSGLDGIISEYNQLVISRNKTLKQATPSNPAVIQLTKDIASLRSLIKENLQKTRSSLQSNISSLQGKVNENKASVGRFPGQEKIFRNIDRQQNIKEALYLFLLQKREETSISLAVTTPKARVVNPAYTFSNPVSPQPKRVYAIALIFGLIVPFAGLYLFFFFDSKIKNKGDVARVLPNIGLLSEIPTADKDGNSMIKNNDLSIYAESFRILTTNLKFLIKKDNSGSPVILFTSSVKGEGKTTISFNAALSLSSKSKIILIGADLRNPQLKRFVPQSSIGLSDYLADHTITTDAIVNNSGINKNFDIIDSGTIPPNPSDLLEDERLKVLIEDLKQTYNFVFIDSAPMMMVSDTFHILSLVDAVVYVTRANYTEKNLLNYIKVVAADDNVKKLGIVLNDVKKDELRYGYGGKYGYGYFTEEDQSLWSKFKNKF